MANLVDQQRADPSPLQDSAGPKLHHILWTWAVQEIRLLIREPVAVFFSLAFPLVIYAFIGTAYADEYVFEGVLFIDIMYPALLGTVAANLALMGIPIYLAELRATRVLRYYASLPMPGWIFPCAVAIAFLSILIISVVLISTTVGISHGLRSNAITPAFIGAFALLTWWLLVSGFFLGSLPLQTRTVQAIATAVFFVMFFGSGATVPLDGLPPWLEWLTRLNPLRHWFDMLIFIYTNGTIDMPEWYKLAPAIIVAVVMIPYTIRNFRRSDLS